MFTVYHYFAAAMNLARDILYFCVLFDGEGVVLWIYILHFLDLIYVRDQLPRRDSGFTKK